LFGYLFVVVCPKADKAWDRGHNPSVIVLLSQVSSIVSLPLKYTVIVLLSQSELNRL
jgi:hypothetical protein